MLKKSLAAVAALLAVLAIVGLFLPRRVHIERAVLIDRNPSLVYGVVNSFQLFPRWSPWQDLDPHLHQTLDGARDGVGARLQWSGNDKVGSGTQTITASVPQSMVASDLEFTGQGVAKNRILLTPDGGATHVTWSLDIDMGGNPIGHYVGLTLDGTIGKDFERGLAKLKGLLEDAAMPRADISGFSAEIVELHATPLLLVGTSTLLGASAQDNAEAFAKAYGDSYARIQAFIVRHKLKQNGAPLGIDGTVTSERYGFEAGIPVERADLESAEGVRVARSYGGKALKSLHTGGHETILQAREKFLAYLAVHGYELNGATFTSFIEQPGGDAQSMQSELYAPVE
jgi:effector-binding domain-containing protein